MRGWWGLQGGASVIGGKSVFWLYVCVCVTGSIGVCTIAGTTGVHEGVLVSRESLSHRKEGCVFV